MDKIKINPIWIALLTFWIPNTIAKFNIAEIPKTILIWIIIAFQIYLLYLGIERLRKEKK